ncbi:MAG: S1 RNA-binding domain-containing protein [Candidatus Aenigmarchaeota archaeon]|nr:S1 RNA-binding domain-containing protein [Candidatus Aenigmarchaeota archaeon]
MGELVICKVMRVNPHSVIINLEEYGIEGMVHISEVSSGWVRDIRQYIKVGQEFIGKVTSIDRGLSVSIKRVNEKQRTQKMKEYKLEQRAEKMLELAGEKLGKPLKKSYDEVGFLLQEKFGTLYDAFKISLQKPENLLKYISQEWVDVITGIAEKNIELKEFEFRASLSLKTVNPEGIKLIKNILKKAEQSGLDVRYIAAPEYLVKYKTKDAKKGEKEFVDKMNKIMASAKPQVSANYKVLGS